MPANSRKGKPRIPAKSVSVSLRRAISAAYYALFHLLISESARNWSQTDLRGSLSRAYDHGIMKAASNRIADAWQSPLSGEGRCKGLR